MVDSRTSRWGSKFTELEEATLGANISARGDAQHIADFSERRIAAGQISQARRKLSLLLRGNQFALLIYLS